MATLSTEKVNDELRSLAGWKLESQAITRTYEFPDFKAAMHFVERVAEKAEAAGHHPDIDIRYNKVKLSLSSHDAGGITRRDIEMARSIGLLEPGLSSAPIA